MLGNIGPKRTDDDFYAAYVGDTVLGQLGLGGRIGQIVRDQNGLAYYARTSLAGGMGPEPWAIYAGVNPDNVDRAIDLILTEVRRFRNEPVSDQELADAKAYLTEVCLSGWKLMKVWPVRCCRCTSINWVTILSPVIPR